MKMHNMFLLLITQLLKILAAQYIVSIGSGLKTSSSAFLQYVLKFGTLSSPALAALAGEQYASPEANISLLRTTC